MPRAILALGAERYEETAAILAGADALGGEPAPDPGMTAWPGLAAEVLARVGRLPEAAALADDLEVRARRARRRRGLASVQRVRALIASANGDLDLALTHALESCRIVSRLPTPFDHGRSLLMLGTIQRRKRERRASDATLGQAAEVFERLGAMPWARQAHAERARTGLRPRAPAGLTPTEATVARLSAEGRTNREVAQATFMSPKTVEANLTRVYQKLGIRNRAELGRRLDALSAATEGARAD
jgi:DNA-binding CsgD family transcriptional regulator